MMRHILLPLLLTSMAGMRAADGAAESASIPAAGAPPHDGTAAMDVEHARYGVPRARPIPWGGLVAPVHYGSGTRQRKRRQRERRTGQRRRR